MCFTRVAHLATNRSTHNLLMFLPCRSEVKTHGIQAVQGSVGWLVGRAGNHGNLSDNNNRPGPGWTGLSQLPGAPQNHLGLFVQIRPEDEDALTLQHAFQHLTTPRVGSEKLLYLNFTLVSSEHCENLRRHIKTSTTAAAGHQLSAGGSSLHL